MPASGTIASAVPNAYSSSPATRNRQEAAAEETKADEAETDAEETKADEAETDAEEKAEESLKKKIAEKAAETVNQLKKRRNRRFEKDTEAEND